MVTCDVVAGWVVVVGAGVVVVVVSVVVGGWVVVVVAGGWVKSVLGGGGGTTETVGLLFGPVTVTVCGGASVGGTGLVFSWPKVTASTTATSIAAANLRKAHR